MALAASLSVASLVAIPTTGTELAKPSSPLQAGGAIACSSDADGDAYIEATGAQYIDTGIKPGRNTRIDIDFSSDTLTDTRFVFGAIAAITSCPKARR